MTAPMEHLATGPAGMPAVAVVEEGMREGLQIENPDIKVADRIRLLEALSDTGLKRIVAGSFVSPKWTPQMARIDEVIEGFTPRPDVIYTALALNDKGVERRAKYLPPLSLDDGLPSTNVHLCDVFARRNTNRSQEQEIASWPARIEAAVAAGATEAQVGIGAAWGSNWLGVFTHDDRMDLLARQVSMWEAAGVTVTKVSMADPMGWNVPQDVEQDLRGITSRWPTVQKFHLHLHNTRGVAPISIYEALRTLDERHIAIIDASIGGMAGCPYCGNGRAATLTPTEDLVHLLDSMGYQTGVDLDRLIDAVILAEEIVGHPLYGHVSKAGARPRPDQLYAMEMPFIETLEQAQHFRVGPAAWEGALSPWKEPITSPKRP